MKKTYGIFLILIFVLILILVSSCSKEKLNCTNSGGKWTGFSNNCVDSCDYVRGYVQVCGQILTQGCDCGSDMCWNGNSCEKN